MPKSNRNTDHPSNRLSYVAIADLKPNPANPRKHHKTQIQKLAGSVAAFGFCGTVLVKDEQIVAGHARVEAAKLVGYSKIPALQLDHLSDAQARAYMLADNKFSDLSSWDDAVLAEHLSEMREQNLEFDIEATGFESAEIDVRIQSLGDMELVERADEFQLASEPAVSALGDLWLLGDHRICCGSALDPNVYVRLFEGEDRQATGVFTDPPYNVAIDGHATGNGRTRHREFPMASGEMSVPEFTDFLKGSFAHISTRTVGGALIYVCMDWRHMMEIHSAGQSSKWSLVNLCVWAKSNGGMGSLYRSRHELIFVFKNGTERHINNVQLGKFGRNRTNVWNYSGANTFARPGSDNKLHPTVKPISMVVDAILDSTKRDDVVLDPFLGSGTTLLAAQRTGRICYGIELDPLYVDTIIERWQRLSGSKAHNHLGETFDLVRSKRSTPV